MTSGRILMAVSLLSAAAVVPAAAQVQVYFNDFEGAPPGAEWSSSATDVTPGTVAHPSDMFLGQFGNETVTLTLDHLPAHTHVVLSFDVYVIRSWDGNAEGGAPGPDQWRITAGALDFNTTFSNWLGAYQSFPDPYIDPGQHGDYPPRTGAAEIDTLGYQFYYEGQWLDQDSVYHLSYQFDHSASALMCSFTASGLQTLDDESWGLDNVTVEVPEPATLSLLAFAGLAMALRRKGDILLFR